jgi:hypothetical protein
LFLYNHFIILDQKIDINKTVTNSDDLEITANNVLSSLPAYELDALRDFYFETNGNNWNQQLSDGYNTWHFDRNKDVIMNPCAEKWQGLACTCNNATSTKFGRSYAYAYDDHILTNSSCHISKIYLTASNLTGTIPLSISNLTELTHLHLNKNHLTNTLPTVLGLLKKVYFYPGLFGI